jgi:S-adenosylmethionine/arginine decarboxylase-like enzyme
MQTLAGTHLIVDGYVKNSNVFNPANMLSLFDELVATLGMTYLTRPIVTPVTLDPTKLYSPNDVGGTSYFCQITTSHIAAHTWELRNAIMLDVFSCHHFNTEEALQVLDQYLQFKIYTYQIVERGCVGPMFLGADGGYLVGQPNDPIRSKRP